jgi:hypothetical protein
MQGLPGKRTFSAAFARLMTAIYNVVCTHRAGEAAWRLLVDHNKCFWRGGAAATASEVDPTSQSQRTPTVVRTTLGAKQESICMGPTWHMKFSLRTHKA